MRHVLSTALVALVVGALAGATVGALAQSEPAAVAPAAVSNVNADKVDGKHAVGANASPQQRKNKLVATNSQGLLPANIVKPPWNRITGIPAGFADGIDNSGVTKVVITRVSGGSTAISPGDVETIYAVCSAGSRVVGGGFLSGNNLYILVSSSYPFPDRTGWTVVARNTGGAAIGNISVTPYAMCLSTIPATGLAAKAP